MTWTKFALGPHGAGFQQSPIVMAISTDRGHTWNNQGRRCRTHLTRSTGSMPLYGPDGALYVAYEGSQPSTGFATDATVIARSTDDGAHFTNVEVGRVYDDLDCYPIFGGRQTLTDEHFRLNSFPAFSIDPVTGHLAVAWADDQGAGTCGSGGTSFSGTTSAQVKLVTGAWGGAVGSADDHVRRGQGVPRRGRPWRRGRGHLLLPRLRLDPQPGDVRRQDPGQRTGRRRLRRNHRPLGVSRLRSQRLDDGFASERRLTSEGSNPFIEFADGSFIGDYSQAAVGSNGVVHAAWTDFRGRPGVTTANQDVYVANFTP